MQAKQGTALLGGQKVITEGVASTTSVSASYPGATITVFNFGTTALSTIFSDNLGTPLANPFTSSAVTGDWVFYAANGHYTVTMSGAGMPATETIADVLLNDPTASTTVTAVAFISASANPATSGVLRMASADTGPAWKSNLGGPDLAFTKNASDVVDLNTAFTIHGAFSTSGSAITAGAISGTTGTFSGAVTGASYSGGPIAGTTGTFTGALSATGITGTTGTFSGAITGASYSGGAISGTTGTFSSNISAVNLSLSGNSTVTGTETSTGGFNGPIGSGTPNTGAFTTLSATGTSTLANVNIGAANTLTAGSVKQVANNFFSILDGNGVSRFFLSNTSPYTNTFISAIAGGSVFLGSAGKFAIADSTGIITMSGATSGTTSIAPSAIASGVLTLPAATDTLVGKATTDTLTNKTLTSPVINGSPTGTGIPTITLKKGSGGGTYSSASLAYVQVDAANLLYTVTIPTGWKLLINASFRFGTNTAVVAASVALADGGTVIAETNANQPAAGNANPGSLSWAISGDGASHTIDLRFKTANAADSVIMGNASATDTPAMTFLLTPSN